MSATSIVPQCSRPGSSRWPGLRRKNVTVSVALTATPITAPVVPLIPLGRSTAQARARTGIDRLDHRPCGAFHRPIEAGAEQRIDDGVGRVQRRGRGRLGGPRPTLRGLRGVTLEPVQRADQEHAHPVAALGQDARGDKTVAAVVARPGDHRDAAAGRMTRSDGLGHRPAGIFHQLDAGHAAGDRQPVGFRHLGGGEQLDHDRGSYLQPARDTSIPPSAAHDRQECP